MATRSTGASSSNLTKSLKGIDFPADKQDLLKQAQHLHAEKFVIDEIKKMDDREYSSMSDVMKSFEPEKEGSRSSSSRSATPSSSSSSKSSHAGTKTSSSHGGRSSHH